MTKHTPTLTYTIGGYIFNGKEDYAVTMPTGIGREKKAELIVKAVNAHDDLVRALKYALAYIQQVDESKGEYSIDQGSTDLAIGSIEEALKKAGA